jgi:flagellar biosynthesis chaperone FliJ
VEARVALGACLRARDAVRHLQERRRLEGQEWATRREQHTLDDLGATRALTSKRTRSFLPGDPNVRR